jgi:hypothetical protein
MDDQTKDCLEQTQTGVQLSSLIAHMRDNNVAYLIGVYVAYSMGLLSKVTTHAAGICA